MAGTVLAATAGWHYHRPPAPTVRPMHQHARNAVDAAERLHSATVGVFKPPKPGEDLNVAMVEMEAAGDRIYTLAAMWLLDRVDAYDRATPDGKAAAAQQVHDAIAHLRQDLPAMASSDPTISQARQDVSDGLDQLAKDVP